MITLVCSYGCSFKRKRGGKKVKRAGSLCVAAMMASSMLVTSTYAVQFSDLPETHWAYADIMKLAEDGVVSGYTDGTYQPSKEITRGEFFKLIMVALYGGEEYFEENGMTLGHWADKYAIEAAMQDYLMADTTIQNLDDPMTRKEMVHVLTKICNKNKIINYGVFETSKIDFTDTADLDEDTKTYIDFVVLNGLINGYTDGTFGAEKVMTRAQVATVISRFLTIVEDLQGM